MIQAVPSGKRSGKAPQTAASQLDLEPHYGLGVRSPFNAPPKSFVPFDSGYDDHS